MRAAPTSTTNSEQLGGGAADGFVTSRRKCGFGALDSRDAQYRSVETASPWSWANWDADTPLARQASTRSDQAASRLCAVNVVMRQLCDEIRTLGRYASSCSGYDPKNMNVRWNRSRVNVKLRYHSIATCAIRSSVCFSPFDKLRALLVKAPDEPSGDQNIITFSAPYPYWNALES